MTCRFDKNNKLNLADQMRMYFENLNIDTPSQLIISSLVSKGVLSISLRIEVSDCSNIKSNFYCRHLHSANE